MKTFKLTADGDLDLSTGTIEVIEDAEAIAQKLRIRLRFFLGEWFLDTRQGVPYFEQILGQKLRTNIVDQIFRRVITTTPGVAALEQFSQSFDRSTRQLSITFIARTVDGETIDFSQPFIVGA